MKNSTSLFVWVFAEADLPQRIFRDHRHRRPFDRIAPPPSPELARPISAYCRPRCPARPIRLLSQKSALAAGIARAQGDWLFFTDADCAVPPKWVELFVEGFESVWTSFAS